MEQLLERQRLESEEPVVQRPNPRLGREGRAELRANGDVRRDPCLG